MQRAKLIKRNQIEEQKLSVKLEAKESKPSLIPNTLKTARTWVEEFQKNKQISKRREFSALFS